MASPGNQHCASCIGTLSLPMALFSRDFLVRSVYKRFINWNPRSTASVRVLCYAFPYVLSSVHVNHVQHVNLVSEWKWWWREMRSYHWHIHLAFDFLSHCKLFLWFLQLLRPISPYWFMPKGASSRFWLPRIASLRRRYDTVDLRTITEKWEINHAPKYSVLSSHTHLVYLRHFVRIQLQ